LKIKNLITSKNVPLFFDWIDTRITDVANYVNGVIEAMDLIWFNGAFNPDIHSGRLPASVAAMPGVNNLIFLGAFSDPDINEEHFRVRMHIAPFTKVSFLVMGPLQDMGFAANQFGEQTTTKKITIVNHSAFFKDYVAFAVPATKLSAPAAVVNVLPSDAIVGSYNCALEITSADYKKSAVLASRINKKSMSVPSSSTSNSPFSMIPIRKSLPSPFHPVEACLCHLSLRNLNLGWKWDSLSLMSLKKIIKLQKPVILNWRSMFLTQLTNVKPCVKILG